jgi:hypothetical protein
MEDRGVGMYIPIGYGVVKNINPILIDQETHKYKISRNAFASIDALRADGATLTPGTDYTADDVNGEFSFESGSPLLTGGNTYYIVWHGDYPLSTSDYMWVVCRDIGEGTFYHIDDGDSWSDQSVSARFRIYGRKAPSGGVELLVDNSSTAGTVQNEMLRYNADRTKFAQSFTLPGSDDYYITRITWVTRKLGSPVGDVWLEIHSDQAGTQEGSDSTKMVCADVPNIGSHWRDETEWSVLVAKEVSVDVTFVHTEVGDIIEHCATEIVGVPSSFLDSAKLAALKLEKTETLGAYINSEMKFGEFLEKLEVGQLFKVIPGLDGKLKCEYYESGEPAGTPHLRDEDIGWLEVEQDASVVKSKIALNYNYNPTDQTHDSMVETENYLPKFFYSNEETLDLWTWLTRTTEAQAIRDDYKSILQDPHLKIRFETSYDMFELYPSQKVKISLSRAPYSGGKFDGVLFRILRLSKKPKSTTCEVTAVLDTQTYA